MDISNKGIIMESDCLLTKEQSIHIYGLPHEFLHNFLHPHLQTYKADAIAPPQPEKVQ